MTKSPAYPSAAEQRLRLRNARVARLAQGVFAVGSFATGYWIGNNSVSALVVAGIAAVTLVAICVVNGIANDHPRHIAK